MKLSAANLKTKQTLYFGIIVCIGVVLLGLVVWSVDDEPPRRSPLDKVEETNITTVGQRINPQEVWVERLESENKLTQKKIDALEKLLVSKVKETTKSDQKYDALMKEMDAAAKTNPLPPETGPHQMNSHISQVLPPVPNSAPSHLAPTLAAPQGVRKIVLKLTGRKLKSKKDKRKTIENTIPAGAFAKAVLIGGVDASTSITAQKDPRPVLLRVTDNGNLPRRFKSDLKACHVLASSYGDLSSERVYMRLEKLTCTERLTGEISETEVSGYIVGEDGRAGVRGIVADRAGPMLRNSFAAGFLSGMSNFFGAQQQKAAFPVSPLGQSNALDAKQMLGAGAAQGTSNALDKYAEFFIKRAEQLQPVLQIAAGRAVDIVFTQGTEFGETSVKKTLAKIRNSSRKQAVQDLESKPDQGEWLPSISQK